VGQQIELTGSVSLHNSKYQTGEIVYVDNVYITAPFTKPSNTDDNGSFSLDFVGLDSGTSIDVQAEKSGLEVVNSYDLQQVVLGRKLPLRIYLIDKGRLAEAQTELYQISKEALYKRKDAMIARLRQDKTESDKALRELSDYFGHEVTDRYEAEKELIARIGELERRLPEFAQTLARQNLDFASAYYIKAYEQFKAGEIENAIRILDSAKLDDSYDKAMAGLKQGQDLVASGRELMEQSALQIQQVADSYELKAQSHYLLFEYAESIAIYEKLVEIYLEHGLSNRKLLVIYDDLALAYQDNEDYKRSIYWHDKLIELAEQLLDTNDLELGRYYNNNALILNLDGKPEESLVYYKKAEEIQERLGDSLDLDLATTYGNLAVYYDEDGDMKKALDYHFKALKIRRDTLGEDDPVVALNYSNLAGTYIAMGNYEKGVEYQRKALSIRERIYESEHPDLANSYEQMALIYRDFGEHQKELEYMEKVVPIREAFFQPDHPIMPDTHYNYARSLYEAGDYEKARSILDKAWEQWRVIFPDRVYWKIDGYYLYGMIDRGMKNFPSALSNHQKSLDLRIEEYGNESPDVSASYFRIAEVYRDMKAWELALENMEKAVAIDENSLEPGHRYLAEDHLLLAELQLEAGNPNKAGRHLKRAKKVIDQLDADFKDELEVKWSELTKQIEDDRN
jgi:tetratricopeptide (TPR) repeat protein